MRPVNRRMPLDKFFAHLDTEYKNWVIKHENGTYVLECKKRSRLLPVLFRHRVVTAGTLCDFVWNTARANESKKV